MLLARHSNPRQHDPKRREQRLEAERERGRSRTISPIALARRAALENAQRQHPDLSVNSLVALYQRASVAQQQQTSSPSPAPPLAESSSMALRREQQRQQRRAAAPRPPRPEPPVQPASGLSLSRSSFAAPPPRPAATRVSTAKTASPLWVENTDDVDQDDEPLPLPDQMQRAYAADDMHTARVIFLVLHRGLRLQFQPSSSPSTFDSDLSPYPSPKAVKQAAATIPADDSRLTAVSEEDLSKVACGGLVVDEATLKELRDAERKDREVQERRQRAIREQKEMERRHKQIEFLASGRSAKRLASPLIATQSIADPSHRVSFHEIIRSVQGPLFTERPDESIEVTFSRRTRTQVELLESLLSPPTDDDEQPSRLSRSVGAGTEAASSVGSDASMAGSTISRSNSWASTASESTAATSVCTSLASSPCQMNGLPQEKLREVPKRPMLLSMETARLLHPPQLQLGLRRVRREPALVAPVVARSDKQLKREAISLSSSPLLLNDKTSCDKTSEKAEAPRRPKLHRKVSSASRVVSAMFLDIAERVSRFQSSYVRAVQSGVHMALPLSPTRNLRLDERKHFGALSARPQGDRASLDEVMTFAPPRRTAPCRELNFPSEFNVPLATVVVVSSCASRSPSSDVEDINGEVSLYPLHASLPYPPGLGVVPHRSPLHPRSPPPTPEWRLRPVSNPALLRLKALQNVLCQRGAVWEGRASMGSIGCGREKLMGVAFEGLGGSRLAFESR
ncbi:hypothetical protein SCHPADRAFT_884763 [Schizopora paradoxa]|uniref:Uncharacterized protein n=1 Tax=Schizopora paradoxa TaxID=27342 RepID=A0A0H2SAA2_9AGAM|nr:hypothetical protein SCHPADRAFT_884763 [Schizopora paradoxa]